MSDATFQRLITQLGLMKAQGIRDAIGRIEFDTVEIVEVKQGGHFDTLKLKICAKLEDSEVPARHRQRSDNFSRIYHAADAVSVVERRAATQ